MISNLKEIVTSTVALLLLFTYEYVAANEKQDFSGVWPSECRSSRILPSKETFIVKDGIIKSEMIFYADEDCKTPVSSLKSEKTFTYINGGTIKAVMKMATAEVLDKDVIPSFNGFRTFGISDWKVGTVYQTNGLENAPKIGHEEIVRVVVDNGSLKFIERK